MGKSKKAKPQQRDRTSLEPLWFKRPRIEHAEDCVRIRQVLESLGFSVTLDQCRELWAGYSITQEGKPEWLAMPLTFGALRSKIIHNVLSDLGVKIDGD